jgi:hypothetical protein
LSTIVTWSSRTNAPERLFQYVSAPAMAMRTARHQRPRGTTGGDTVTAVGILLEGRLRVVVELLGSGRLP